jgi:hypothetical protein
MPILFRSPKPPSMLVTIVSIPGMNLVVFPCLRLIPVAGGYRDVERGIASGRYGYVRDSRAYRLSTSQF